MLKKKREGELQELSFQEIEAVSGANSNTTEWAVSVATAGAFLGMAFAVANPVGIGILAGASIFSSGAAIWYRLSGQ